MPETLSTNGENEKNVDESTTIKSSIKKISIKLSNTALKQLQIEEKVINKENRLRERKKTCAN